ncbi:MAG: acyl-CoA dehydrogenase family protein [Parvibaculaceae bacterium]
MSQATRQPKNFGFDEDEQALRSLAEKVLSDKLPTTLLHELVARGRTLADGASCRWDTDLWKQVVELGWLATAVPERVGGLGMSAVAVAALVEQAGMAAMPGPFVPTLGATYLLDACRNSLADNALALICEGKSFSYAVCDRHGSWDYNASELTLDNNAVSGSAYFVQDAQKVDYFLVNAKCEGEPALLIVPADAKGLSIRPNAIIDLTRDQAILHFDNVEIDDAQIVSAPGGAIKAIQSATPALLVLNSADICGAAEWQLQTTVDYARTRKQFEHTLGFYQAVKHPLVEFMVAIDLARGLLYNAACAIDHEPDKAEEFARMAKSAAADAAAFGSKKSIQLHGGIGFTWECFVHVYLKRQLHSITLMGDASYQRVKLAEMLLENPNLV